MTREGNVIRFDDDEGEFKAAFAAGLDVAVGGDLFIKGLLAAFSRAGGDCDRAWKRVVERAQGAGLVQVGERLVWHRGSEVFTVAADCAKPASRRHLQDILADLEAAKVAATKETLFPLAASIHAAADTLRDGMSNDTGPSSESPEPDKQD